MANDFHHGTLVFEFLQFVLFDDLSFNLLYCDDSVLPPASVNDTITTLGKFLVIVYFTEGNLVVLDECSGFV